MRTLKCCHPHWLLSYSEVYVNDHLSEVSFSSHTELCSRSEVWWQPCLLSVQEAALSCVNCCYPPVTEASHDWACHSTLLWWSLLEGHIWFSIIYCWLSWASPIGRHHLWMVCEVSTLPFFNSCHSHDSRCTALPSDLDGPSDHRTQELTEILLEKFGGTDGQVL